MVGAPGMSAGAQAVRGRAFWQAGLLGLVVLRLGMWWLLQHDIPHMLEPYNWGYYYGGDEALYIQMARQIGDGTVVRRFLEGNSATVGVGLPLIFAGLMIFLNLPD